MKPKTTEELGIELKETNVHIHNLMSGVWKNTKIGKESLSQMNEHKKLLEGKIARDEETRYEEMLDAIKDYIDHGDNQNFRDGWKERMIRFLAKLEGEK